jgi:hypothetical protein
LILGLTDGALFTKAKSGSRGEVAHYTPHAAIWISPEFEDQVEIIFLILVFLYSETKRLDVRRNIQTCRPALMSPDHQGARTLEATQPS